MLGLGAAPVRAQDVDALLAASRPAVVRLLYPGRGPGAGCTGVVASGVVLTAGHCLGPRGTGRPEVIHDGRTVRTTRSARHPEATGAPDAADLARLDLAEELPGIGFGPGPERGEVLLLMGYRNDMDGVRSELFCAVLDEGKGLARVACPVQNGMSGAPLIRAGADGPEVAAIVVGRAGLTAIAAIPDAWARGE